MKLCYQTNKIDDDDDMFTGDWKEADFVEMSDASQAAAAAVEESDAMPSSNRVNVFVTLLTF